MYFLDMTWYTYILECSDKTLYTGVTTDMERRLEEHNSSPKGAKYTRARRPLSLIYTEQHQSRSEACKAEARIKAMSRAEKLEWIKDNLK
jgi:putative endonuclease